MTEERYHAVQRWFRARPAALKLLVGSNRALSLTVYGVYAAMLLALLLSGDPRLLRAILVPALVFAGGTLLRAALNFPRPYEVYHTPALAPKDRKGQSFPSRHMFSSAVLTVCGLWLWPPAGWLLAAVTLLLAPIRVLTGVHFIRDVAAGILLGGLLGWLGFFIL